LILVSCFRGGLVCDADRPRASEAIAPSGKRHQRLPERAVPGVITKLAGVRVAAVMAEREPLKELACRYEPLGDRS